MNKDLTIKSILLEKINRLLNPNFNVKFIWTLLCAGLSLVGYQRIIQMASKLEFINEDFMLKLSLSSGVDNVFIMIGFFMVLAACFFFYRINIVEKPKIKSYKNLAKASLDMRQLLDDNRRIFVNFGPQSSAGASGDIRFDLDVWENLKSEKILPNNQKILSIIKNTRNINSKERSTVDQMVSHIEAFEAHCDDPTFDYSNNQFPLAFSDLIFHYCELSTKDKNRINDYSSWLQSQINGISISVENMCIFGSAIYGQESTDVDVLIKTKTDSVEHVREQANVWSQLSEMFTEKFKLNLHLSVFSELETKAYEDFLAKIPDYKKIG